MGEPQTVYVVYDTGCDGRSPKKFHSLYATANEAQQAVEIYGLGYIHEETLLFNSYESFEQTMRDNDTSKILKSLTPEEKENLKKYFKSPNSV